MKNLKRVSLIFSALLILLTAYSFIRFLSHTEIENGIIALTLFVLSVMAVVFYWKLRVLFYEIEDLSSFLSKTAGEKNFIMRPSLGKVEVINDIKLQLNKLLEGATDVMAESVEKDFELEEKRREAELARELKELNEKLLRENRRSELLLKVVSDIVRSLDFNTLLKRITSAFKENLGYSEFAILMKTERGTLKVVASYGLDRKIEGLEFQPGEGVSSEVLRTGKLIYVRDTFNEPKYLFYKGLIKERGSLLSVPVRAGSEVVGVMNFHSDKIDGFTEEDIETIRGLSNLVGIAFENAMYFEKLKFLSIHDDLTGAYNRRYLMERLREELTRAQINGESIEILMIDFDNFKAVNDNFGHLAGDQVLRACINAINRSVRDKDIVGRYGGDEFVIVMPGADEKTGKFVEKRIKDIINKQVVEYEGKKIKGLSISVARLTIQPSEDRPIDTIFKELDKMLLKMKAGA